MHPCKTSVGSAVLVSFLMMVAALPMAAADGCVFKNPAETFQVDEEEQYAVINHHDGYQEMFISIKYRGHGGTRAAWVFPVPTVPDELNVVGGSPQFDGDDVLKKARRDVADTIGAVYASYLVSTVMPVACSAGLAYVWITGLASTGVDDSGVEVHRHVERQGFVSEAISADSGQDIYNYLKTNGVDVQEGMVPQLDDYVRSDYSFVVSWALEDTDSVKNPGVWVGFGTERPYYPMMLTSSYGDLVVPTEVIVTKFVTLDLPDHLDDHVELTYYDQGRVYGDEAYEMSEWQRERVSDPYLSEFNRRIQNDWDRTFTRITINAPAGEFRRDIWMEEGAPMPVAYAKLTQDDDIPIGPVFIVAYAFFSMAAGIISGMVVFNHHGRKDVSFWTAMGLLNLLGVLMLLLVSYHVLRKKGHSSKKALRFNLYYQLSFLFMLTTFSVMVMLPLHL